MELLESNVKNVSGLGYNCRYNNERKQVLNEPRRIQGTRASDTSSKQGGSLVGAICYNYRNNKERRQLVSANVYTIENLLVGKQYYSRTTQGEIVSAEKHPQAVWYNGAEAYRVQIRKSNGGYTYRSVAVNVGE